MQGHRGISGCADYRHLPLHIPRECLLVSVYYLLGRFCFMTAKSYTKYSAKFLCPLSKTCAHMASFGQLIAASGSDYSALHLLTLNNGQPVLSKTETMTSSCEV
eukprot:GHRR01035397.1.p1 GENE.GHRR01035397.1~~GHRR01035397.1.p1  ORF type:complete len:104 (+),score=10.71 GHRR01035397.1:345-656(+)